MLSVHLSRHSRRRRTRSLTLQTLESRRLLTADLIDYAASGSTYNQSFDSLASSGMSATLPDGWHLAESGSNANGSYSAGDGAANQGDAYSYGPSGGSERALGSLRSGSLVPTIGAAVQNNTGQTLTSLTIGYRGEQWRLGTSGRDDRLDFQYSFDATTLTDGTWIDHDPLDFDSPSTSGSAGSRDGNSPANQENLASTIGSLSIVSGSTFWFRWVDSNASGADDGLAIDDFFFSASSGTATNTPPSISTIDDEVTGFETPTDAIPFTIGDAELATSDLIVSAVSSNTALVTPAGITFGGSDAARTIMLDPADGQSGVTTIVVTVSDGELSSSTSFQLTVNPDAATSIADLRIVSYNIAAASGDGSPRAGFDTLLKAMGDEIVNGKSRQVDLFALQEVLSQSTTSTIIAAALNTLYGTTAYAAGTLNGGSSGSGTQGVVYNTETLELLGEATVGTVSSSGAPRQTLRHKFRPVQTNGESDFYVYNSHFKASGGSQGRRFIEAEAIRNDADSLGQGAHVIYVGDFNVFTSSEPAYQELLSGGNGQAFDPINRPGNWRNNSSFRDIFTQAPSATIQPSLGLDGGGMDDRLDFQLISGELRDDVGFDYRTGSYHTFGVNGSVALNGSIDDSSNTALPELSNRLTVLGLLRTVSDHLPVVADYTVPVFDPVPRVTNVTIDDGTDQRSIIRSITVTFDRIVDTPASAFTLTNLGKQGSPSVTPVSSLIIQRNVVGAETIATITFGSGPSVIDRPVANSLADGEYRLDIAAEQITETGGGASMASDFVLGDEANDDFFRLFGDGDGNGITNFADFSGFFLPAFGGGIGPSSMDADGDGRVNFADFAGDFLPNFGAVR